MFHDGRLERISELFHAARRQPPEERGAYIGEQCCGNEELRSEVESLLSYEDRAGEFLEQPAMAIAAEILAREPSPLRLTPGDRIGAYVIVDFLGAGGMGEVYKAVDTRLGRSVALKLISGAFGASVQVRARLFHEARTVSALTHPNICILYDIGEYKGEPFLVMELLDGQPLSKIVASGPVAFSQLLDWSIQIANGLSAAHTRGIVHCDIKPANIFITYREEAKILDFGVAKLAGEQVAAFSNGSVDREIRVTVPGVRPGTPGYMSPEQLRGEQLDSRSDLFSLGVVLHEMATAPQIRALGSSSNPSPGAADDSAIVSKRAPPALARIIAKLQQNEAGDRYQSASELVVDLRRVANTRGKRVMGAGAVLVLAAAALAIFTFFRTEATAPIGREWVQITSFPDSIVDPAISSDATLLTFLRGSRTFTPFGQIYVMRLPDGEPQKLTDDDHQKMSPAVSPDGLSIGYTRISKAWEWDTWVVPISGGPPRIWLKNASGLSWIAPRRILFSAIHSGLHMGIATSDDRRDYLRHVYIPRPSDGMAHRSYLSPDGRWVLTAEMDGAGWLPCRLVAFDGSSRERQVGPPRAACTSAAWSPDGKWMYFSANVDGSFHIWRQRHPDGALQQVTSGATEEEGIAMSHDGRSIITSVGTGASIVWIHDKQGQRALSDQGFSFSPRISPDGKTVYYLAGPRQQAFWAEAGELWSADLTSGRRRRFQVRSDIAGFAVDAEANRVFFVAPDPDRRMTLWVSSLESGSAPRRLADNVFRELILLRDKIVFRTADGVLIEMSPDGENKRALLARPVVRAFAASPDGNWLAVEDRAAWDGATSPTVLYQLSGLTSRIPLCASCSVSWVGGGYLHVRFAKEFGGDDKPGYLIPISRGDVLPSFFRSGRLVSEEDIAVLPGVRVVREVDAIFGPDLDTYVYTKRTVHRNLFRIPLE